VGFALWRARPVSSSYGVALLYFYSGHTEANVCRRDSLHVLNTPKSYLHTHRFSRLQPILTCGEFRRKRRNTELKHFPSSNFSADSPTPFEVTCPRCGLMAGPSSMRRRFRAKASQRNVSALRSAPSNHRGRLLLLLTASPFRRISSPWLPVETKPYSTGLTFSSQVIFNNSVFHLSVSDRFFRFLSPGGEVSRSHPGLRFEIFAPKSSDWQAHMPLPVASNISGISR
jgi:hypothetical protein